MGALSVLQRLSKWAKTQRVGPCFYVIFFSKNDLKEVRLLPGAPRMSLLPFRRYDSAQFGKICYQLFMTSLVKASSRQLFSVPAIERAVYVVERVSGGDVVL